MQTSMLFMGALLPSIVISQAFGALCKHDLSAISKFGWPMLSKFGQSVANEATLANIGRLCKGDRCSQHMVLHTGDRTYLWGSPNMFLLDNGNQMRELEELYGHEVTDIRFGRDFIVIVTAGGIIWTAGLGQYGQLAQYDTQDIPVFNPVKNFWVRVRRIAVGKHHAVALVRDVWEMTHLYSWGFNSYSRQLGYASTREANPIPKAITLTLGEGKSISDVQDLCCGWEQCAAVVAYSIYTKNSKELTVVTWGDSRYIGRPWGDGDPAEVEGIPSGEIIDQVACGRTHTLALTRSGRLFAWGSNEYGEILNAASYSNHATELDVKEVGSVVAGDYLTLIGRDSGIEHFGWYDGKSYWTPQKTNNVVFPRDVMAESYFMSDTNGDVRVGCKAPSSK